MCRERLLQQAGPPWDGIYPNDEPSNRLWLATSRRGASASASVSTGSSRPGARSPSFETWGRICKLFGWPQTFALQAHEELTRMGEISWRGERQMPNWLWIVLVVVVILVVLGVIRTR